MLGLGLALARGPSSTSWGQPGAVPRRGRAALGLFRRARPSSKPEHHLPRSLTILQACRGRREASKASSSSPPPPRSSPAGLEPRPGGARALVECDTPCLQSATQLWLGKGRARSAREGEGREPFIRTPPAAACRSLFLSLPIKAESVSSSSSSSCH